MKYVLSLIGEETGDWENVSPDEMKAEMDRWTAYGKELADAGVYVASEALQDSGTATTLRLEGEERVVTDGPFAETKEQLGGFYVIDCESLDEAIEWAKKVPPTGGSVEIRPVMDFTEFGYEEPTTTVGGTAS
jgi:hypothetical protein